MWYYSVHIESGFVPVPPSGAPSGHNLPSLRVFDTDTSGELDYLLLFFIVKFRNKGDWFRFRSERFKDHGSHI